MAGRILFNITEIGKKRKGENMKPRGKIPLFENKMKARKNEELRSAKAKIKELEGEVKGLKKEVKLLRRGIDAFQRLGAAYRLGRNDVPQWVFDAITKVEEMPGKE